MSAAAGTAVPLPAALGAPGRPTFAGAVRSELLKLRRQAMTWVLLAGVAGLLALVEAVFLFAGTPRTALERSPATLYFGYLSAMQELFAFAAGVLLLLVSSRLVGMEYGSGTIRIALARGTGRLQLLGAQALALLLLGVAVLAAFAAVAAVVLVAAVLHWNGSLAALASLPAAAWRDTWINAGLSLLSVGICVLLGMTAAVVGRSLAFGVGAAMAFFPTDNFGILVLGLIARLTHQDVWLRLTTYLLGPNLNELPVVLQPDHRAGVGFATPLQPVDATHSWVVVGAYAAALLVAAVALTWRRDVLH